MKKQAQCLLAAILITSYQGEEFRTIASAEDVQNSSILVTEGEKSYSGKIMIGDPGVNAIETNGDTAVLIADGAVETTGQYSHAVSNKLGVITYSGNVSTKEKYSFGVSNERGNTFFSGTIGTDGAWSHGVHNGDNSGEAGGGGSSFSDVGTVTVSSTIKTLGDYATGFWNSQIGMGTFSGTISTVGSESHGVVNERNTFIGVGQIQTDGDGAIGIKNEEGEVTFTGQIKTFGESASGIYAMQTEREDEGKDRFTEHDLVIFKGTISTKKNFSHGLFAEGGDIRTKTTWDGSASSIDTSGKQSHGAYTTGGKIELLDKIKIIVSGEQSYGIFADQGGQVNLTGQGFIQSSFDENSIALRAENLTTDSGEARIVPEKSKISAQGTVTILGDISSARNGDIRLTLASGSYIKGKSLLEEGGFSQFLMTGTKWDMTGSSQVTNLEFSGSESSIYFLPSSENKGFLYTAESGDFSTLTVGNLAGTGGHLYMNTDIRTLSLTDSAHGAGTSGDLLVVQNQLSGDHLVSVPNRADAKVTGEEILTIIQTGDVGAESYFRLSNQVEFGGYLYDLKKVKGTENHLALQAVGGNTNPENPDPENPDPGNPNPGNPNPGNPNPGNPNPSNPNPSNPGPGNPNIVISNPGNAVNLQGGNYMIHHAELQTLMRRLGDLRGGIDTSKDSNIWGRIYGGKMQSESDGALKKFDMSYRGIQVGADRRHNRKDQRGASYIGGFFGYTDGDLDYVGGQGDMDSLSLGAYWTYIHRNGFYADVVLKYGWMKNEYDIVDSAGLRLSGKGAKSDVLSLSMEIGRRYFFDRKDAGGLKIPVQEREGFYIEPQAQVTVSHLSGDSFTQDNGLQTRVGAMESTIARVGTHFGYESKNTKNPMNFYVKGYFMKEFDGNIDFAFNNGLTHTSSYEDTWFVYGLGATAKLGERHNLYLDFERWTGGRMEQDWAINGGYRYSW